MPWDAETVMDEKVKFVAECLAGVVPMTVLCERYGISRETGYVWKRRYDAEGVRGLEERSRAPHHHGNATPAAMVRRSLDSLNWRIWGVCMPWDRQMRCTELTLTPVSLAIAPAVRWSPRAVLRGSGRRRGRPLRGPWARCPSEGHQPLLS